ncbi:ribonuclease E/G [Halobacillus shinanisalinarum]|uniref:Ribonuclease E/G n=1 Tax=Halobacillus shinanisalinarum TaxID=2932258 RepID=A0ABY4H0A0_9BACI|nr:ribonuclease E/G [Halobacillus shinanisalinarum]UOQ93865.1 ribonuclease E/G [Halobacillus shinanisalinarum]
MRTIAVHTQTSEQIGIVLENNDVIEYVTIRPEVQMLSGSIYLGKVSHINKAIQAAFIDIGEERTGFLKKESIPWAQKSIESTLKEGQSLTVQVTKEPEGTKGAQLTADITVPGLFVIYQPYGKRTAVSKRIDAKQAEVLRTWTSRQLDADEGVIVRTAASNVSTQTILNEIDQLRDLWARQIKTSTTDRSRKLVDDPILPDQLIRKHPLSLITEIVVNNSQLSQSIKQRYPMLAEKVKWVKNISSYTGITINELQSKLIQPVVVTEQGMELVIEQTEAMTVIDINSHKFKQKTLSSYQKLEMNKTAAVEVARQIQLRNISGIILVDYISMQEKKQEKELLKYMSELVRRDPVSTTILGITRLGLMEITRQRRFSNVSDQLTAIQKPAFSKDTLIYRLERYLTENIQSEAVLVAMSPDLYYHKKQLLSQSISSKIPQELFVRQDSSITDWQIELEGSLDMIQSVISRRVYHVDNLF